MCDILGDSLRSFFFLLSWIGKCIKSLVFSSFSADVQGRGNGKDQITSVDYTETVVADRCAVLDESGQRISS